MLAQSADHARRPAAHARPAGSISSAAAMMLPLRDEHLGQAGLRRRVDVAQALGQDRRAVPQVPLRSRQEAPVLVDPRRCTCPSWYRAPLYASAAASTWALMHVQLAPGSGRPAARFASIAAGSVVAIAGAEREDRAASATAARPTATRWRGRLRRASLLRVDGHGERACPPTRARVPRLAGATSIPPAPPPFGGSRDSPCWCRSAEDASYSERWPPWPVARSPRLAPRGPAPTWPRPGYAALLPGGHPGGVPARVDGRPDDRSATASRPAPAGGGSVGASRARSRSAPGRRGRPPTGTAHATRRDSCSTGG